MLIYSPPDRWLHPLAGKYLVTAAIVGTALEIDLNYYQCLGYKQLMWTKIKNKINTTVCNVQKC